MYQIVVALLSFYETILPNVLIYVHQKKTSEAINQLVREAVRLFTILRIEAREEGTARKEPSRSGLAPRHESVSNLKPFRFFPLESEPTLKAPPWAVSTKKLRGVKLRGYEVVLRAR
jgi:hypothetical protein